MRLSLRSGPVHRPPTSGWLGDRHRCGSNWRPVQPGRRSSSGAEGRGHPRFFGCVVSPICRNTPRRGPQRLARPPGRPVRLELSPTSWRGVRRHAGLSGSLPTGGFTLGPPRLFVTSSRAPAPSRVFSNSLASAITPCELAHDASTLRLPIGIGTRHKVVCLRGGRRIAETVLRGDRYLS